MVLTDIEQMTLQRAQMFCIAAHGALKQTRKYTGEPYHVHPLEVASLLQAHASFYSVDMLVAAMLHDVVEDTGIELNTIDAYFGRMVMSYVADLTDLTCLEDGNRAERKRIDNLRISQAKPNSKTIKLCDIIDNLRGVLESPDKDFVAMYYAEKREQLKYLKDGDPTLYNIAHSLAHGWKA